MLVLEYDADSQQDIRVGGQFHSCNIEPKRWKQLPIPAKEYLQIDSLSAPVSVEK